MDNWLTPVLVLAGIIISSSVTGAVTYFVARRNTSGSISTSDAASLWKESNALRKEYKQRAEDLEKQLADVNQKLQSVMQELGKMQANTSVMESKIIELQSIIASLREEIKRLLAIKDGGITV